MRGPRAGCCAPKARVSGEVWVSLPLPHLGRAGRAERARNGGCEEGVSKGDGRVGGWISRQGGNPGSSSAEGSQSRE